MILAANVKQRGDQTITSEDDLVAPSIETEVFTSKHTQPDTKKNEVEDVKGTKAAFYENSKCFELNFICLISKFFSSNVVISFFRFKETQS